MLYFFKVNLLTVMLEYICSVFHFGVINPFKLSVKINRSVDWVKMANLGPLKFTAVKNISRNMFYLY